MMLHVDKCLELGLPEPKPYEHQLTYIKRILLLGFNFNTRMARYCGVGNLHSLIIPLERKGIKFTLEHGRVKCHFTGETPPYPVDIISMTADQIALYKKTKIAKT